MSIAEKLTTVAENTPKVYDAGKQAQTKAVWEAIQDRGARRCYTEAFRSSNASGAVWNDSTFQPIYDIISGRCSADHLFYHGDMTHIDVNVDLRNATSAYAVFARCGKLKTVKRLWLSGKVPFDKGFLGCGALENLKIANTVKMGGLDVSDCPLTRESLMSIINCLADYSEDTSGTQWVVTLGTTNLNKLTDAEKAIATQKGWTLA